jgi:hypothetical protein
MGGVLTGAEQLHHAQVADGEPHDGGLVQVGPDAVGHGQLLGQLVEHLRLLPPPAARRIPRLLLPAVRAHPAGGGVTWVGKRWGWTFSAKKMYSPITIQNPELEGRRIPSIYRYSI